jgi:hypothetical protein
MRALLTEPRSSNVVNCEPIQVTWSGGTPPYFLSLLDSPTGTAVQEFVHEQNVMAYSWNVDEPNNPTLYLVLRDSQGQSSETGQIPITGPASCPSASSSAAVGSASVSSTGVAAPAPSSSAHATTTVTQSSSSAAPPPLSSVASSATSLLSSILGSATGAGTSTSATGAPAGTSSPSGTSSTPTSTSYVPLCSVLVPAG